MEFTTPSSNGRTLRSERSNCGSNPCGVTNKSLIFTYIFTGAKLYYEFYPFNNKFMKFKIFDTSKSTKILVFIIWLIIPFIVGVKLTSPHTELYMKKEGVIIFDSSPFSAVDYNKYILLSFKYAIPIYIISAIILFLLFRIFKNKK